MRFAVLTWLCLVVVAALTGSSLIYGQDAEPPAAPPVRPAVHKLIEPLEAPPVSLDAFAGKTVRDRSDGLAIIKARAKNLPQVGTPAPDFELKTADGQGTIQLSSFRGERPVVLIFGSVT